MPERLYYVDLARRGLVMPIGTDLVLQEAKDPEAMLVDGEQLGRVVAASAERWQTPLAVPLMDLRIEKEAVALVLGAGPDDHETFHLDITVDAETIDRAVAEITQNPTARMRATCDAIRYVAELDGPVPIGMCIGPFSFMTKLIADPIMPVYMAGVGSTAVDDPEVALMESALALGHRVILAYVKMQAEAGAKAMVVCEPAANIHFLSPKQIQGGSDIFDRYVMKLNKELKALLEAHGVDLIFHNCGELTDDMVRRFGELDPAIISLGSSRVLWEDSSLLPENIVMYGNLPSKRFYSDEAISPDEVTAMSSELLDKMAGVGRPFILGTECDVLSVPGSEKTIRDKVDVMMRCCTGGPCGHTARADAVT
jgi:uroporphyrinogen decarboxylase